MITYICYHEFNKQGTIRLNDSFCFQFFRKFRSILEFFNQQDELLRYNLHKKITITFIKGLP